MSPSQGKRSGAAPTSTRLKYVIAIREIIGGHDIEPEVRPPLPMSLAEVRTLGKELLLRAVTVPAFPHCTLEFAMRADPWESEICCRRHAFLRVIIRCGNICRCCGS